MIEIKMIGTIFLCGLCFCFGMWTTFFLFKRDYKVFKKQLEGLYKQRIKLLQEQSNGIKNKD